MRLSLLFLSILQLSTLVDCFLLIPKSASSIQSIQGLQAARRSEYNVIEDNDDNNAADHSSSSSDNDVASDYSEIPATRNEYAALMGGQAVQIEVGDLALGRKAWKKRRRSGSPLLVPCSVLNLDRASMLRWNLLYLLYRHGSAQKDGTVLSTAELTRLHKKVLKGRLANHATEMGYGTAEDLIQGLFSSKATQDTYGVRLVADPEGVQYYLKTPRSKFKAKQKAAQAKLLQVVTQDDSIMKHTGYIRYRDEESSEGGDVFPPLSAALRVSPREDIETGKVQQGSIQSAVLFDFDPQGDGGMPLLTLSLNPTAGRQPKLTTKRQHHPKYAPLKSPRQMLDQLQVGEGPFDAKVVKLARDHALVDFGIGRKFSSAKHPDEGVGIGTPEFVKVFGKLRFKDAIDPDSIWDTTKIFDNTDTTQPKQQSTTQDDEVFASMKEMLNRVETEFDQLDEGEELEDITHLFSTNADGSLNYQNPETGETELVKPKDDEPEEEEDQPTTFAIPRARPRGRSIRLRVGDIVPVHILSVSKQSSQFMVTTDPSAVRGKKAKDIKKQGDVSKKLERLSQMLGGLEKAQELKGREYEGRVKATSQTGDWLYVEPFSDIQDGIQLPVGVAVLPEDLTTEFQSIEQGDMVRIQMDGIDESRGQLAMKVIGKLSP